MADEKKTVWVFDLDTGEFTKKTEDAADSVKKVGDKKNLKGLVDGLANVGKGAVALYAVFKSLEVILKATFRADRIEEVNRQFEFMTQNAGIATHTLSAGLERAAGGLIETTELLEASNKAILQMGSNAKELPKIMDVARKATALMGGDLTENFNRINEAIASGATGGLEAMGIVVDQDKAYRQMAKSLGITTDALSKQEQQQAVINGLFEESRKKFKGIDIDSKSSITSWQRLTTTVKRFGDSLALIFDKFGGEYVSNFIRGVDQLAEHMETKLIAKFGEGARAQKAQSDEAQKLYYAEAAAVLDLENAQAEYRKKFKYFKAQDIADQKEVMDAQIAKRDAAERNFKQELSAYQRMTKGKGDADKTGAGGGDGGADLDKRLQQQSNFERELVALRRARVDQELMLVATVEQAEALHAEKRRIIEQEFGTMHAEVEARVAAGTLQQSQASELLIEIDRNKTEALKQHELDLQNVRNTAQDNYLSKSQDVAEGVERAFTVSAQRAAKEQKNFAAIGTAAVQSFEKNAVAGFMAIGEGSQSVGDAMKGFMLGALADIAESQGRLYLLQGFTNPALFGAGAALLVLAGALRSQGGAGGGGAGGGSSSGGGGGDLASERLLEEKPETEEQKEKKVEINFQGDFLNTDETATRFTDLVRQATDATDFQINALGQG